MSRGEYTICAKKEHCNSSSNIFRPTLHTPSCLAWLLQITALLRKELFTRSSTVILKHSPLRGSSLFIQQLLLTVSGFSGSGADWAYPHLSAASICSRREWARDPCWAHACALLSLYRIMVRGSRCWGLSAFLEQESLLITLFALDHQMEEKKKALLLKRGVKRWKRVH